MAWDNKTKNTVADWNDNIEYLVSEALDFLLTENSEYLITNQSTGAKATATWTNNTKL